MSSCSVTYVSVCACAQRWCTKRWLVNGCQQQQITIFHWCLSGFLIALCRHIFELTGTCGMWRLHPICAVNNFSGLSSAEELQMLLFPNALCCSPYERNCVWAVTNFFTKFLPADSFCQLLLGTRKRSCTSAGNAQVQLHFQDDQQRAFGISNISNYEGDVTADFFNSSVGHMRLPCMHVPQVGKPCAGITTVLLSPTWTFR